jgi:hypothetical protein
MKRSRRQGLTKGGESPPGPYGDADAPREADTRKRMGA